MACFPFSDGMHGDGGGVLIESFIAIKGLQHEPGGFFFSFLASLNHADEGVLGVGDEQRVAG